MRSTRKKLRNKRGGGGLPLPLCSVDPEHMPKAPVVPFIDGDTPFPKPWVNVNSNIFFIGLVVSETSAIGKKIKTIAASANQDPYLGDMGAVLLKPHLTLLNTYLPQIEGNTLHSMLSSKEGFTKAVTGVISLVKKNIIDKKPVLLSKNGDFQSFGKFVVKKYDTNFFGHFTKFKNACYKPFKDEFCELLGSFIGSKQAYSSVCYPAYFPPDRLIQKFIHYSDDATMGYSNFAIAKYFEEDLSPHISLIKSNDEAFKVAFIEYLKQMYTGELDILEISPLNFSSVFISYMGNWASVDL